MSKNKTTSAVIYWLLKIVVIAFIVPFFYKIGIEPGFEQEGWNWFIKILFFVLFVVLAFIILFLNKTSFYNFGFFLVFIRSVYEILEIAFQTGFSFLQIDYFLLIVVSFYFMTKADHAKKRRRHS